MKIRKYPNRDTVPPGTAIGVAVTYDNGTPVGPEATRFEWLTIKVQHPYGTMEAAPFREGILHTGHVGSRGGRLREDLPTGYVSFTVGVLNDGSDHPELPDSLKGKNKIIFNVKAAEPPIARPDISPDLEQIKDGNTRIQEDLVKVSLQVAELKALWFDSQ